VGKRPKPEEPKEPKEPKGTKRTKNPTKKRVNMLSLAVYTLTPIMDQQTRIHL